MNVTQVWLKIDLVSWVRQSWEDLIDQNMGLAHLSQNPLCQQWVTISDGIDILKVDTEFMSVQHVNVHFIHTYL